MNHSFVKLQGLGNDFIILDESERRVKDWPSLARTLCRRRWSVGADGLIRVEEGAQGSARVWFYNADGSRAETCGNGLRCAAHFVRWRRGTVAGISLETDAGLRKCHVTDGSDERVVTVRVEMGRVQLRAVATPEVWHGRTLEIDERPVASYALGVGNPHLVLLRPPREGEVEKFGAELSAHPDFPRGVNVEWVELLTPERVRVAVHERGVGPTLACGSGAVASVAALILSGQITAGAAVDVELAGGVLRVGVERDWQAWIEGPSVLVCEGDLFLPPECRG